jgi:DNA-binding response OmpR family regulator
MLGRRILIVEDDLMIAMLIEDMLADLGHVVAGVAGTVAEGTAMVEAVQSPEAAILDINLGGESVFPLADTLRARGVPMIFSTGYADAGLREADRDSQVLRKPFRIGDLDAALKAVFDRP